MAFVCFFSVSWYSIIFLYIGIAAGPLWASKCTYLTSSAIEYSKLVGKEQGPIVTHFFGIFSSIVQSGYIFGGVLMSVILKPNGKKICFCLKTFMVVAHWLVQGREFLILLPPTIPPL